MKPVTTRKVALSMVRLGHHKDLIELRQVKAFDLRLPLLQDNCDSIYCLERPIQGKRWEIHPTDGDSRMLTDEEALTYLDDEQRHVNDLRSRGNSQTKHLKALRRMIPIPSIGEKAPAKFVKPEPDR